MMTFIVGMCISLPLTLLFPFLLEKMGVYTRIQKEKAALLAGHYCAKTLSTLIPFIHVKVQGEPPLPEPTVWVCNHSSMLDVFVLLAHDDQMRGPNRRPIKIVYVSILLYCLLCISTLYCTVSLTYQTLLLLFTVETTGRQSRH